MKAAIKHIAIQYQKVCRTQIPWMEVWDGHVMATDGHVLVALNDTDDLEDGIYILAGGYWQLAGIRFSGNDIQWLPGLAEITKPMTVSSGGALVPHVVNMGLLVTPKGPTWKYAGKGEHNGVIVNAVSPALTDSQGKKIGGPTRPFLADTTDTSPSAPLNHSLDRHTVFADKYVKLLASALGISSTKPIVTTYRGTPHTGMHYAEGPDGWGVIMPIARS